MGRYDFGFYPLYGPFDPWCIDTLPQLTPENTLSATGNPAGVHFGCQETTDISSEAAPDQLPCSTAVPNTSSPGRKRRSRTQAVISNTALGRGLIWAAYPLRLFGRQINTAPPNLIAKICFAGKPDFVLDEGEKRRAVHNEAKILAQISKATLSSPLAICPTFYGLYGGIVHGLEVWVMLMQDAGEAVDLMSLSPKDK